MPAKPVVPVPTIPAKLFPKMKIVVAGRFSYFPSKEELVKFLKREGATVVESVSTDTDMLVVGSGAKPALQKQAEKLNTQGAGIQIVSDLSQLFQYSVNDSTANITDAATLTRLCLLPDYILGRSAEFIFVGDDFAGRTIGGDKSKLNAAAIVFEACNFKKGTLHNISFQDYVRYYTSNGKACMSNCSFEQTQLERVTLGNANGCTFDKATMNQVEMGTVRDGSFKACKATELETHDVVRSVFEKCTIDRWKIENYGSPLFLESHLIDCKIERLEFPDNQSEEFNKSELRDTSISNCAVDSVCFTDCTLVGVVFRDCSFGKMVFKDCKLSRCAFENVTIGSLQLQNTTIASCRGKNAVVSVFNGSAELLSGIKGLEVKQATQDLAKQHELQSLASTILKATRLEVSFEGTNQSGMNTSVRIARDYSITFAYRQEGAKEERSFGLAMWGKSKATKDDVVESLLRLVQESSLDGIELGSLQTKSSKSPVKASDLKKLIVAAIFEAMGKQPQSEEELAKAQKQAKDGIQQVRQSMVAQIMAGEVSAFNRRSATDRKQIGAIKKLQLKQAQLAKLNASGLDLSESDFSEADLSSSNLSGCNLRKVNLSHAKLRLANLKGANLRGADLSHADLTGAKLPDVTLDEAVLVSTNLEEADLTSTNLSGIDLSQAKLDNARLKGSYYNEKTSLPTGLPLEVMKTMRWIGGGIPPHERKLNAKAAGPLDFQQFMDRLTEITDRSRLQKSMQMLKKDSFKLFCEVSSGGVMGVVKSQSDADLVYSCMLDEKGDFTCCTQNLNPCGGLRGAICKHILVLVVGLAKNNELDPTKIDEWVNLSKLKAPSLDKDRMSEILLKYKGAEAGEIDWRPTETVPEDFFAF
jgi:uncharacterized protein YjbI with pentapeptide repeats